jgi:XTP/dITP diphosphohydrolase
MKLCFASNNQNKLKEIAALLPEGLELVGLADVGITEDIPETGETLAENSSLKARYVFERKGIAVFADDTGLEVSALNGAPGVYSARYAGPQRDAIGNMDLLLKNLAIASDRSACFKTVITYIDTDGSVRAFEGRVDGEIIHEKRGTAGFGYDPIFVPEGEQRTFAEMSGEEKNRISHRARAFEKLLEFLNSGLK